MTRRFFIAVGAVLAALAVLAAWGLGQRLPELDPAEKEIFAGSGVSLEQTGAWPGLDVSWVDGQLLLGTDRNCVYESKDGGQSFDLLACYGKATESVAARLVSPGRLAGLLVGNLMPRGQAVRLSSGTVLVFYHLYIYRLGLGEDEFKVVHSFASDHQMPFARGIAVGPGDMVYFGEYDNTPRPHAVRIWQGSSDGRNWQPAHTFAPGQVVHVHSVSWDKFRKGYWVCTGDLDHESGLYFSGDDFKSLSKLGGGSQDWRIVSLVIRPDDLLWCSDDDQDGSKVFRYSFSQAQKELVQPIGKPCYHAEQLADGTVVLSTTYEPESVWTQKTDPRPSTELYLSRRGRRYLKVWELDKDQSGAFAFRDRPRFAFPLGPKDPAELYMTPLRTSSGQVTTLRARVSWQD